MSWFLEALGKYAEFDGRARRKEYWMFVLFSALIGIALSFVEVFLGRDSGTGILTALYNLAILLPSISVAVRRMHDTNHSGLWSLVPIANLLFAIREGQPGENRFGPDPKATGPLTG